MTEVVPIRIPMEVLEKIELLVRLGKYANKREAIRTIIIEHLEERKEVFAYEGMLSQDKKIFEVAESFGEKEFSEFLLLMLSYTDNGDSPSLCSFSFVR